MEQQNSSHTPDSSSETSTPRRNTMTAILIGLALCIGVGMGVAAWKTGEESGVSTNRTEALQIAANELRERGINPDRFTSAIVFRPSLNLLGGEGYLAQFGSNSDFDAALDMVGWTRQGWNVSYVRDGSQRAIDVRVTPQGRISRVDQTYPNMAEGAKLSEEEARNQVEAYLKEVHDIPKEHIVEQGVERKERDNRTDYTFTYHFTEEQWQVENASLAFQIEVEGENVNGLSPRIDVPEKWRNTEGAPSGSELVLIGLSLLSALVALGIAVWGVIYALRENMISGRVGKWLSGVYVVSAIIGALNAAPGVFAAYGVSGTSFNNFLAITIGGQIIAIAFIAFIVFLAISLGVGSWKRLCSADWGLSELLTEENEWNTPRLVTVLTGPIIVAGLFFLGRYVTGVIAEMNDIYIPSGALGGMEQGLTGVLGTYVPFVAPLTSVITLGCLSVGGLGLILLARQVLGNWISVGLLGGVTVGLAFFTALKIAFPISTVGLLVGAALFEVLVVLGWIVYVLRTNLFAYVIAFVEISLLSAVSVLIIQPDLWVRIQGGILLVGTLVGGYAGLRYGLPALTRRISA